MGLIYGPALDPLLDGTHPSVGVVELEPQMLWEKIPVGDVWHYRANEAALATVAAFPLHRLMHGVGQPLGGSVPDPVAHLDLLRSTADRLGAAWISEHLSFNRVPADGSVAGGSVVETGFLLPPQQSPASVRVAARNVRDYGVAIGRPVAFETGTNYLRPRDGELPDGQFWRSVADGADSGILLDLHNLWCNEQNGRGTVLEVIDQLPLDRVWEVHLAGGMELSGYWLDAHSDVVPPPLMELASAVIPRLPNLGALMFEVLPEHVPRVGLDAIGEQLTELGQLWRLRPPTRVVAPAQQPRPVRAPSAQDIASVQDWEIALHRAISGSSSGRDRSAAAPDADPGLLIYRDLIAEFRFSSLAQTLRYTVTLLLAGIGSRRTRELLAAFTRETPVESFRMLEAENFSAFLLGRLDRLTDVPYLAEVLAYEHALVRAVVRGESSQLEWTADPSSIMQQLEQGRLPERLPPAPMSMTVSA